MSGVDEITGSYPDPGRLFGSLSGFPGQRQMDWEPPDLVEEAVYRSLSGGKGRTG